MSAAARIRGLYAVTPDLEDTGRLVGLVEAALEGGARVVQYRNKTASPALKLEQAHALNCSCARARALFIVNDDVELAVAVHAGGVHLGREDDFGPQVRRALGPDKAIGVSCYQSIERAREAVADGADHVAFGSFFPSKVKPGASRPPIELITRAKAALGVPVVAIGGITAQNAKPLVDAGADALAVITALFDAADVRAAAAEFASLFASDDAQR